jgi:hypothetical protein
VGVPSVLRQPRGAGGNWRSRALLLRPCCRAAGWGNRQITLRGLFATEAAITQHGDQRNAVPAQLEECALQTLQKKRDRGSGKEGLGSVLSGQ